MDIGFHGITSGVQYKVMFMGDLMDIGLRMRRIDTEIGIFHQTRRMLGMPQKGRYLLQLGNLS